MTEQFQNRELSDHLGPPAQGSFLLNSYFWIITGVVLVVTGTFSALLGFADGTIWGLVLLSWLVFLSILARRAVQGMREDPPGIPDFSRWNQYDVEVRKLSAKVQQYRDAKKTCQASTKAFDAGLGWKRGALASATTTIRSRSFFREREEGSDESGIASQIFASR